MKRQLCVLIAALVCYSPVFASITPSGDVNPSDPSVWDGSTEAYIGEFSEGSVVVDGGSSILSGTACIGYDYYALGTVTVQGADSNWENYGSLWIGNEGEGALNILSGGTVMSYDDYIGFAADSIGQVTVDGNGSVWETVYIQVGEEGQGTLHVTNSGQVIVDSLLIGSGGDGRLEITKRGIVNSSYAEIGSWSSTATGFVEIEGIGSSWDIDGTVYVGNYGGGVLNVVDGGALETHSGYVGNESGSAGNVTVDGFNSSWHNSANLYIGYSGAGVLEITNGGLVSVGNVLTIDNSGSGNSSIDIASGGRLAVVGSAGTIAEFFNLISGQDAIRYWDDGISDWAIIAGATAGVDYALSSGTGSLSGYTVLTVMAEPAGDVGFEWSTGYSLQTACNNGDGIDLVSYEYPPANMPDWNIDAFTESGSLYARSEGWLVGEVKTTLDGGYVVNVDARALLEADLQDAGSTQANAGIDYYFLVSITIPAGRHYAYTLPSDDDLNKGVKFSSVGDGDLTFVHKTCELNDSLMEQGYYVLRGRSEPYLLYGGMECLLSDTTNNSMEGSAEVTQKIRLTLTPVTYPHYNLIDFSSFSMSWGLVQGQTGYNDNWDLVENNMIDIDDLVEFCDHWIH